MALAHKVARDSMAMTKAMTNLKARDFKVYSYLWRKKFKQKLHISAHFQAI